ncbi:MAG: hypothetical protein RL024_1126, partial [Actinomycetota bacterium]
LKQPTAADNEILKDQDPHFRVAAFWGLTNHSKTCEHAYLSCVENVDKL